MTRMIRMKFLRTAHRYVRYSRVSLAAAPESGSMCDSPTSATSATNEAMHKHPWRLDRIWMDSPIYFITMCTKNRREVLARGEVVGILIEEWRTARKRQG